MDDFLHFDTQLTEQDRQIRESIRTFADDDIIPLMDDACENATFPTSLIPKIAQLGLLGMTLPKQYGGSEVSYVAYGLACQELERGDSAIRSFVSVQSSLCMYPIYKFGTDKQKEKYLHQMSKGELIGCFCLTEADSGSDPASMHTTAKKVSGGWELNGSKTWITNAPIADLAIVWAKTPDGIRGFIVEKSFDGFETNEIHHKMSLRVSITGEVILKNCVVPDENLLPGTEKGLVSALSCLTQARYGIAWGAMGAAMACYEAALSYTLEREQFGKPLASFQLIQQDLVNMLSEIVKAQALNMQLGKLFDEGKATHVMISLAKRNACREAIKIARSARNLLGANGISLEYPVIRHMTNLESVFTYEGTDNIHTLILGKHITGIDAISR